MVQRSLRRMPCYGSMVGCSTSLEEKSISPLRSPTPPTSRTTRCRTGGTALAKKGSKSSRQRTPHPARVQPSLALPAEIPVTYAALDEWFARQRAFNPWLLRRETIRRIESVTGRPLVCYVAKTSNLHNRPVASLTSIDDQDIRGFNDLISTVPQSYSSCDVFVVSNGGRPETTERIVQLIRRRFESVRFIVPSNAFSAATMMTFSGDEIVMAPMGSLGPIDPQIDGVPVAAILGGFLDAQERLAKGDIKSLRAYGPLINKLDLHLLEMCRMANELSRELAESWISEYMLKCKRDDPRVREVVEFFASAENHKTHGRSVSREKAQSVGLVVKCTEEYGINELVQSLFNQYEVAFDKSNFVKLYENVYGVNWGTGLQIVQPNQAPPSS